MNETIGGLAAKRPAATLVEVSRRADLARVVLALQPLLERSPETARAFLANPVQALRAAGLDVGGEARALLQALGDGKLEGSAGKGLRNVRIEPAPMLRRLAAREPAPVADPVARWIADLALAPKGGPRTDPRRKAKNPNTGETVGPDIDRPHTGGGDDDAGTLDTLSTTGSHPWPLSYTGTTGDWDVVMQVHRSLFTRLYNSFFAGQTFASALLKLRGVSDDPTVVEPWFTFESWLLVFMRAELSFDTVAGVETVTMDGADTNEVGLRARVTCRTSSRWTPSDPWKQTDEFQATIVRYGKVKRRTTATILGQTLANVVVADLAEGRTVVELDGGADEGREQALGFALDAFFADELPELVLSGPHVDAEPFVTWSRAAASTVAGGDTLGAVNVCYGNDGSDPFHTYILDYGRNLAVGVSDAALLYQIRANQPDLPIRDGGTTVESLDYALRDGYIEVTASGTRRVVGLFTIGFDYTVRVSLAFDGGGNLVPTLDHSRVDLPDWLWFASAALLEAPGLVLLGIANVLANTAARNAIGAYLPTGALVVPFQGLSVTLAPGLSITVGFDRVEVNPNGVFFRGNLS